MYSAIVLPFPRSLMFLISASGNVFSRPTRMPTRFITFLSFHYASGVRQTSVCRNLHLCRLDFIAQRIDKLKFVGPEHPDSRAQCHHLKLGNLPCSAK